MADQKSNMPANAAISTEQTLAGLVTRYQANIVAALPAHVKPERVLSVIRTAITSNPGLRECSPMSVLAGIVAASRLGLELDPALGQAYLVPRWSKNTKRMEASFQIGYQGKLELIRRADPDVIIQTRHIRENDEFDLVYDPKPVLTHRINARKPRGKVIASYTYVQYPDGRVEIFEPMTVDEALAIRDRFAPRERCKDCYGRRPARDNCVACKGTGQGEAFTGPWLTDEEEMIRKTCFRRDSKWLKKAVEMQDAVRIENRIDAGEAPETVVLDLPVEDSDNAQIAVATDAAKEDLKKKIAGKRGGPVVAPPTAAVPQIVPKVEELPDPLDDRFEQYQMVAYKNAVYERSPENTGWRRCAEQGVGAVTPGVEFGTEDMAMGVLAAAARKSKPKDPQPDAFEFETPSRKAEK